MRTWTDPTRQTSLKNGIMLLSEFMEQQENTTRDISLMEYQQRLGKQINQLGDVKVQTQIRSYIQLTTYTFGRE